MSKWDGMWGPRWAAQIAPIVDVLCPFTPCGTQSSFAPWLPSRPHSGHVVQVGFMYMGPIWAAPDSSHVGNLRFIPCGLLVYGTHVGRPRFIPCGLLVYGTHVGSPRFIPCGKPQIFPCGLLVYRTHVGSSIFIPRGKPHIFPVWDSGI